MLEDSQVKELLQVLEMKMKVIEMMMSKEERERNYINQFRLEGKLHAYSVVHEMITEKASGASSQKGKG